MTATRTGQALGVVVYNPLGWALPVVPVRVPISIGTAQWELIGG